MMQSNMKLAHVALGCLLLSDAVLLLVSAWAQAPHRAQIAFFSYRDGNSEIYVMDADGKNPRNLTNNPASDGAPDWFGFAYAVEASGRLRGTWGWLKQTSR